MISPIMVGYFCISSAVPVGFTVSRAQLGTYNLDVDGQRVSFTVVKGASTTGSPNSSGLIIIVIMGMLVLSTVVVLILTFRRPT